MTYTKTEIPDNISALLYGDTELEKLADRGCKAADWLQSQELPASFTLGPAQVTDSNYGVIAAFVLCAPVPLTLDFIRRLRT